MALLTGYTSIDTATLNDSDVFHVVDVSNTSQNISGSSFKLTIGDFRAYLLYQTALSSMTITNVGSGDSFRVNDASGDTTPFIIDNSGNVVVGGTSANSSFDIQDTNSLTYNPAATDGQLSSSNTLFLQQKYGSGTSAFSQLVMQPFLNGAYCRMVAAGGASPYLDLTANNTHAVRLNSSGNTLIQGRLGINGLNNPAYTFDCRLTSTTTSGTENNNYIYSTSTQTATVTTALNNTYATVEVSPAGGNTFATIRGYLNYADNNGAGTLSNCIGHQVYSRNVGGGIITGCTGVYGTVQNYSTGNIGTATAGYFYVDNNSTGQITATSYGVRSYTSNTAGGVIANASGVQIETINTGSTITNWYGLRINAVSGGTITTNRYPIYVLDTGQSYMAGNLALGKTSGATQALDVNGFIIDIGKKYVTSDYSKTSSTTFGNITNLSVDVEAGKTYNFRAKLNITAGATGGHKYVVAGTCTATDIRYRIVSKADGVLTDFAINSVQQTALAGAGVGQAGSTAYDTEIEGTITVNAAGTLVVQFAQNVSNATASVVKRGSTFFVTPVA
jgi:hypothetical protein